MRTSAMLAPVLVLALEGCSTFGGRVARLFHMERPAKLEVRAAPVAPQPQVAGAPSVVDRLYAQARFKVETRAYADALDLLQLARARSPDDPRVLNAMGVVYDKIGRLDLSGRYYEQALAAEPGSPVVMANMRYSKLLETRLAAVEAPRRAPAAALADTPAAVVPSPQARAAAEPQRTAAGAIVLAAAPEAVNVLRAGAPVLLVDASGQAESPGVVRDYLASAGWSVAEGAGRTAAAGISEIRYRPEHRALAEALARTLPFKVTLSDCAGRCAGLELVVGHDAPRRLKPFAKEHS